MENFPLVEYSRHAAPATEPEQFEWDAVPSVAPTPPSRPDDAVFHDDLSAVTTRQLRILCNQTYRLLDRHFPPMNAVHSYEALVEEIERRAVQAEARAEPTRTRAGFRDNALFSRFDVIDVEPALIRQVLLNAYRRRIAVVPYCPRVREFLTDFPQYRALLSVDQRRRLEAVLLAAGDDERAAPRSRSGCSSR